MRWCLPADGTGTVQGAKAATEDFVCRAKKVVDSIIEMGTVVAPAVEPTTTGTVLGQYHDCSLVLSPRLDVINVIQYTLSTIRVVNKN